MNCLCTKEIDILIACSNWVDAEVKRQELNATIENKQKVFSPFKSLIKFREIMFDEIKKIGCQLRNLLNDKEIASFLLHLVDQSSSLEIECRTLRPKANIYSLSVNPYFDIYDHLDCFENYLTVTKNVSITSIQTLLGSDKSNLNLNIYENNVKILNLKCEKVLIDDKWCFKFNDNLQLNAINKYELHFTFDYNDIYHREISKGFTFRLEENGKIIEFTIEPINKDCHCINKINIYD